MFKLITLLLIAVTSISDLCDSEQKNCRCERRYSNDWYHEHVIQVIDMQYCQLDIPIVRCYDVRDCDLNINHNNFHFVPRVEGISDLVHLSIGYNQITHIENFYPEYWNLINLDLSHNSISSVEKGAFSVLTKLRKIDLSFNKLTHLAQETFHLQTLKEIYLNNNQLVTLNLLLLSNNLERIDISYNGLKAVQLLDPYHLYKNSTDFHEIDLKIHLGNNITDFHYQLLNRIKEFILSGNNLIAINVTPNAIMSTLNLARNRLRTTANCTLKSNYLEYLYLQDNQLETIETHWLDGMNNIRVLNLTNNRLTVIDGQFKRLIALETLLLKANRFESIEGRDYLTKSDNLREIDLSENQLTVIETPLNYHSNLTKLNLSRNKLRKVNGDSLNRTKPIFLYVSHNRLQSIDIPTASLSDLIELDASNNDIKRVDAEQFRYAQELERINLSDNLLDELPIDLFVDNVNLKTIDLSHNKLTEIFGTLINHTTAATNSIDLSNNFLNRLASNAFNYLHQLNHLNLSFNKLDDLPIDLFVDNVNLKTIDLSHNKLTEIFGPLMNATTSEVVSIDLSNNLLNQLGSNTFNCLHQLNHLNLSSNELDDLPIDLFVDNAKLNVLDLSHNNLRRIKVGQFRVNPDLTTLNLSHNKLKDIKGHVFYELSNLTSLHLDFNELSSLKMDEIAEHLPNLKWIALEGNTWSCSWLSVTLKYLQGVKIEAGNGTETDVENIRGIACDNDINNKNNHNRNNADNKQFTPIRTPLRTEDDNFRVASLYTTDNVNIEEVKRSREYTSIIEATNEKYAAVINNSHRAWNDFTEQLKTITQNNDGAVQRSNATLIITNIFFLSIIIALLYFAKKGLLFKTKKVRRSDSNDISLNMLQEG